MTVAVTSRRQSAVSPSPLTAVATAALPVQDVLDRLGSGPGGIPEDEAQRRLQTAGPNAVRSHRARAVPVLVTGRQTPGLKVPPEPEAEGALILTAGFRACLDAAQHPPEHGEAAGSGPPRPPPYRCGWYQAPGTPGAWPPRRGPGKTT